MDRIRSTLAELREDLGPWWLPKSVGAVLLFMFVLGLLYLDIVILFAFKE